MIMIEEILKQNLQKIIAKPEKNNQSNMQNEQPEIFIKSPIQVNPVESLEKLEKALSKQKIDQHFEAFMND